MNVTKYTQEHEWLRVEDDGSVTVGITDYAQEQLGDIVFVELPEVGSHLDGDTNLVVIESVKAVGEVKLAVGGTVLAVNEQLADAPELVNSAPLGDGWLLRVKLDDASLLERLMDSNAYQAYIAEL
ncbi:MAG: glycine cleavage system protein GcvH [Proteobacteria bacterium]|nr:glycine cleavage system protein GcvH [Pseudomonadota bacterium]MBK8958471.1 glycine cleavage system protein GcvH [Pseudomonadota bacterium]